MYLDRCMLLFLIIFVCHMGRSVISQKESQIGLIGIISLIILTSAAFIYKRMSKRKGLINDIESWTEENNKSGKHLYLFRKNNIPKLGNMTCALDRLIDNSISIEDFMIDMGNDILPWLNGNINDLRADGGTEVDIINGHELSNFIRQHQETGSYIEVTSDQLDAINTSIIIVALNENGDLISNQMIRSNGGITSDTLSQFCGKPVLKIIL